MSMQSDFSEGVMADLENIIVTKEKAATNGKARKQAGKKSLRASVL